MGNQEKTNCKSNKMSQMFSGKRYTVYIELLLLAFGIAAMFTLWCIYTYGMEKAWCIKKFAVVLFSLIGLLIVIFLINLFVNNFSLYNDKKKCKQNGKNNSKNRKNNKGSGTGK